MLEDYTTEELKAEISRRQKIAKEKREEEMRNALCCRNCKHLISKNVSSCKKIYQCSVRTWGKNYPRNYTVALSKKACEKFERKEKHNDKI